MTTRAPRRIFSRVGTHAFLIMMCLATLYPLLWMIRGSVSEPQDMFTNPGIIPSSVTGDNYVQGWSANPPGMGRFLVNSVIVCLGAVIGNLVGCTLAAYAFARLRFPGKPLLFAVLLGTVMLPAHVTLIPQYTMFTALGWVNTYLPLIVPKFLATDAFFVFLLVQFFRSIPTELDEAAEIDGCGHFGILVRILLPLSGPALATAAVFTFIWTYEDFMGPLIYLADLNQYTVPLGLRMFVNSMGESSYGQLFAMSALTLAPIFVVFMIFQKQLVAGIGTTGLKG